MLFLEINLFNNIAFVLSFYHFRYNVIFPNYSAENLIISLKNAMTTSKIIDYYIKAFKKYFIAGIENLKALGLLAKLNFPILSLKIRIVGNLTFQATVICCNVIDNTIKLSFTIFSTYSLYLRS